MVLTIHVIFINRSVRNLPLTDILNQKLSQITLEIVYISTGNTENLENHPGDFPQFINIFRIAAVFKEIIYGDSVVICGVKIKPITLPIFRARIVAKKNYFRTTNSPGNIE